MPILNRAAELQNEVAEWRRHIHANPGLLFDVEHTAAFVAEKLKEFGVDEIATGIGRTGVVGLIRGRSEGRTIGLRADMDALPLTEISGKPWASTTPGKMHACGHDGHTAMLLGAAKYLAETRNFDGNIAVIFQPAEEGGGGGNLMVKDGMMERFRIEEVYGMHNLPGLPVGQFAIRKGSIMAATDEFNITIKGRGGHAAMPHTTIDPIAIGAQVVTNLQLIASRSVNPLRSVVVSVTKFIAGSAMNVIPNEAKLSGTVRTLDAEVRDLAEKRLREVGKQHRRRPRRRGRDRLSPQLPGHLQPRHGNGSRRCRSLRDRRPRQRQSRDRRDDGRRGLLLHAQRPPRRLHLHRQRRHSRPSQPRLRFQRRGDLPRHLLLGTPSRTAPCRLTASIAIPAPEAAGPQAPPIRSTAYPA